MSIEGREQLTKDDVRRIEEEIDYRKQVVRPKALEDLKYARSLGDLSENFEYYAAKRANNQNNSRIRYLEKLLRTAHIIEDSSGSDEVGLNNTVEIYFEERDMTATYRIVTPIRSNIRLGLISNESPIGKALLGKKVGDRIEVELAGGIVSHIVIKRLEKTGDSSEDRINQY